MRYIAFSVDDLLFVLPDLDKCQRIKDGLKREYGHGSWRSQVHLGIQVHCRSNGGIFLSQRAYLKDVLLRLACADARTAPTPMQLILQLAVTPEDNRPFPAFRSHYLQPIGSLMYNMLGNWSTTLTMPWVFWAAALRGQTARTGLPSSVSWHTSKATLDFGFKFQPDDSLLGGFEAYLDSDWGTCPLTSRSTMGYIVVLAADAVSWLSKLQPGVTAISTYIPTAHMAAEVMTKSLALPT